MRYIESPPKMLLRPFIEKIWYCASDEANAALISIPSLNHELVFNFSEQYHIYSGKKERIEFSSPTTWFNGLQTRSYRTTSKGYHEMMGVLFKPAGLKSFVKFSSNEFTNIFVDTNLVFGNPIRALTDQLQETPRVCDKMRLVEEFLTARMNKNNEPPRYLDFAVNEIMRLGNRNGIISEISAQIRISRKSLIETFNRFLGVSPTKFLHLHQVNKAIHMIAKRPEQRLTDLAYRLDYFDQAHFCRVFKSITTLTPSEYAKCVKSLQATSAEPHCVAQQG